MRKQEIKRKFLVLSEPVNCEVLSEVLIHQTYVATSQTESFRVSRKITRNEYDAKHIEHFMSFILDNGVPKEEHEFDISELFYKTILANRNPSLHPLVKVRRTLYWRGSELELDTYPHPIHENVDGKPLQLIEVVFNCREDAESFQPAEWFNQDVTNLETYATRTLWERLQKEEN